MTSRCIGQCNDVEGLKLKTCEIHHLNMVFALIEARRGGSNDGTHNLYFGSKIRKIGIHL